MRSGKCPATIHKLVRFLFVGGVSTAIHIGSTTLLVERANADPILANLAGFAGSFLFSFISNLFVTFGLKAQGWQARLGRYAMLAGFGFVFNAIIMYAFVEMLDMDYRLGLLAIVVLWPPISFAGSNLWVFAEHRTTR